ncbi:MAG: HD domain-containing protein [Campylobacterota bacterium]|nr:HD domain-containing protein [Campylobacterota bacterium]
MSYKSKIINSVFWTTVIVWSLVVFVFMIVVIRENYQDADIFALNEARTSTKKDLAFRSWVASHGGVYVPITERTPPNPYLKHIENRDIETLDGKRLTLMNPAYILSQIMSDYSQLYGVKGQITSKILLNPQNQADQWELKALNIAEKDRQPVYEKSTIDDKLYYRYLKPLIIQKSCLKCHGFQGYKVGDVRGGVSVSIPMKPYQDQAFSRIIINAIFIIILWIFGMALIYFGRKKAIEIILDKIKDYEQSIYFLIYLIETRDRFTAGHTKRVAKYSKLIAKDMNYSESTISELYTACMLHDIGKISTPDSILLKPGALTDVETKIMHEHVTTGYKILKKIDIYQDIAEIMRHHHERYDGSGYPQGLKGSEIPVISQIISIADVFDAMTTNRVYKDKLSVQDAIKEIKKLSGTYFDPALVEIAIKSLQNINIDDIVSQSPQNSFEIERFSYYYKDQIIDGYNKDYLYYIINHNNQKGYKCKYNYIYIIYLHNFDLYNKSKSWRDGDLLLQNFADKLNTLTTDQLLFRVHGDDFIILSREYFDLKSYEKELNKYFIDSDIRLSFRQYEIKKDHIESAIDLDNILND